MKGEPRLSFRKLGHLLKVRGLIGKHRVPVWEIALGLVLYQLGLSFRKKAKVSGLLGEGVSHVAVWYWKAPPRSPPTGDCGGRDLGEGGGKEAWIYVALDPRTLKVVYLEPFFVRDEGTANAFLEHLVEAYGEWPREVITDGGGWLWAAFSFWQVGRGSDPLEGGEDR